MGVRPTSSASALSTEFKSIGLPGEIKKIADPSAGASILGVGGRDPPRFWAGVSCGVAGGDRWGEVVDGS